MERQGRRAAIVGHSRGGTLRQGPGPVAARPGVRHRAAGLPRDRPAGGPPARDAADQDRRAAGQARRARHCSPRPASTATAARASGTSFEAPLPRGVGYVSVYSRTDGIVAGRPAWTPPPSTSRSTPATAAWQCTADVYRVLADSLSEFRRRDARRRPKPRHGGRPAPAPRRLAVGRSADRAPAIAARCRTSRPGRPPFARRTVPRTRHVPAAPPAPIRPLSRHR